VRGTGGHFTQTGQTAGADQLLLHRSQAAIGGSQRFGQNIMLRPHLSAAQGHTPGLTDELQVRFGSAERLGAIFQP